MGKVFGGGCLLEGYVEETAAQTVDLAFTQPAPRQPGVTGSVSQDQ